MHALKALVLVVATLVASPALQAAEVMTQVPANARFTVGDFETTPGFEVVVEASFALKATGLMRFTGLTYRLENARYRRLRRITLDGRTYALLPLSSWMGGRPYAQGSASLSAGCGAGAPEPHVAVDIQSHQLLDRVIHRSKSCDGEQEHWDWAYGIEVSQAGQIFILGSTPASGVANSVPGHRPQSANVESLALAAMRLSGDAFDFQRSAELWLKLRHADEFKRLRNNEFELPALKERAVAEMRALSERQASLAFTNSVPVTLGAYDFQRRGFPVTTFEGAPVIEVNSPIDPQLTYILVPSNSAAFTFVAIEPEPAHALVKRLGNGNSRTLPANVDVEVTGFDGPHAAECRALPAVYACRLSMRLRRVELLEAKGGTALLTLDAPTAPAMAAP